MPNGNIFLNYRREDTEGYARLIHNSLNTRFPGCVFRDVTDIPPGADFVEEIGRKLETCQVLLVVIGKDWLTVKNKDGRRLDDEQDFVRLEVATGLRRDIRVIPVLVEGASMPHPSELPEDLKPLARRNAVEIIDRHGDDDFKPLIRELERIFGAPPQPPPPPSWPFWKKAGLVTSLGAAALFFVSLALSGPRPAVLTQSNSGANPVSNSTPPDRQANTPAAKPTPAAAEPKQKPAVVAATPTPVSTEEAKVPPAHEAADSFNPVGTWEVHRLDNPADNGTLTITNSHRYTVRGKINGADLDGAGTWQQGEGPRILYFTPSNETASYKMEIVSGGGGVYRATDAYFGRIKLRRVSPR